jgi:hypothetical protein
LRPARPLPITPEVSSTDSPSHGKLPDRSRTVGGELPPEVEAPAKQADPQGASALRHGANHEHTHHHRRKRRKPQALPRVEGVFSDSAPADLPPAPRQTLLVAFLVLAGFLIILFFAARFFHDSGVAAGMQRALAADQPLASGDADTLPQARVFSGILNLRSSNLDRPTVELLTPVVLAALQATPSEALPDYLRPGHSTVEDFAAAYVAMRLGDFGQAAAILRDADAKLPPDQFSYLMNDPALREFSREPRVMGFY